MESISSHSVPTSPSCPKNTCTKIIPLKKYLSLPSIGKQWETLSSFSIYKSSFSHELTNVDINWFTEFMTSPELTISNILQLLSSNRNWTVSPDRLNRITVVKLISIYTEFLFLVKKESKYEISEFNAHGLKLKDSLKILFDLLTKMFVNNWLSLIEIETIIKYIISRSISLDNIPFDTFNLFFTNVFNFFISICGVKNEDGLSNNEFIGNILTFLSKITEDEKNIPSTNLIFNWQRKNDFWKLFKLVNNTNLIANNTTWIVEFISFWYKSNFSNCHWKYWIESVKSCWININKYKQEIRVGDIKLLESQLEALEKIHTKCIWTRDSIGIEKGYVINESGIEIENINFLNKEFTIILSFRIFELPKDNVKYTVCFFSCLRDELKLYINSKAELKIENTETSKLLEEIQTNKTYLVWITYKKSPIPLSTGFSILINSEVKKTFKGNMPHSEKKTTTLQVGYMTKYVNNKKESYNMFQGLFGPMLIFNALFPDTFYKDWFTKIKSKYYLISDCLFYNFTFKISVIASHSNLSSINESMEILNKYRKELFKSLKLVVTTPNDINNFQNNKNKKLVYHQKYPYYKNDVNIYYERYFCYAEKPIVSMMKIYPFKINDFIEKFTTYDGVSFLTLMLEYYITWIQSNGIAAVDHIYPGLFKVWKLAEIVVTFSTISTEVSSKNSEQFLIFVFSLTKLININIIEKILDILLKLLPNEKHNQNCCVIRMRMIFILLKVELYGKDSHNLIEKIWKSIHIKELEGGDNVNRLKMWLKFRFLFNPNIPDSLSAIYKSTWKDVFRKLNRDDEIEFLQYITKEDFIQELNSLEQIISLFYLYRSHNIHNDTTHMFVESINTLITQLPSNDNIRSLLVLIILADNKEINKFKTPKESIGSVAEMIKKVPLSLQLIKALVLCWFENYKKTEAFNYISHPDLFFHPKQNTCFSAFSPNIKEFIIFIIEDLISPIEDIKLLEDSLLIFFSYLNEMLKYKNLNNKIKCWVNHIFESNKICSRVLSISWIHYCNISQSSFNNCFYDNIKNNCFFFYIQEILPINPKSFVFSFLKGVIKNIMPWTDQIRELFMESVNKVIEVIKVGMKTKNNKNIYIVIKEFLVFIYKINMKYLFSDRVLQEKLIELFRGFVHEVLIKTGLIYSTTIFNFNFSKELHQFSIMEMIIVIWDIQDKSTDNAFQLLDKFYDEKVNNSDISIILYYDCWNDELKYRGKIKTTVNYSKDLLKDFKECIKATQQNKVGVEDKSWFWMYVFKKIQQDHNMKYNNLLKIGYDLILDSKKLSTSKYDFDLYNKKIKIVFEHKKSPTFIENTFINEIFEVQPLNKSYQNQISQNTSSSIWLINTEVETPSTMNETKVTSWQLDPGEKVSKLSLRSMTDYHDEKDSKIQRKNSFKMCDYCDFKKRGDTDKNNNQTTSISNNNIIKDMNNNYFNLAFWDLTTPNCIICLKRDLLLKQWSIYFTDVFFQDKSFEKIISIFTYNYILEEQKNKKDLTTYGNHLFLEYPSTIRNYSISKYYYPKIFLKKDLHFYNSKYFRISHSYIHPNFITTVQPIPKHNHMLNIPQKWLQDKVTYDCEVWKKETAIVGKIYLSEDFILFQSVNDLNDYRTQLKYIFSVDKNGILIKEKQIVILFKHVEEIIKRNFLYMPQAVEVFLKNGKSYFFNLFSNESASHFFQNVNLINNAKCYGVKIIENQIKYFINKSNHTKEWWDSTIDNWQYLWYLNKFSNRSYNDWNQYPVMPWVIIGRKNTWQNNSNSNNNNEQKSKIEIRNFLYPISVQNAEKREEAQNYFKFSSEETNVPCHFNLHYSTSSFILWYWVRLNPYTNSQITFQNNEFDSPDRQLNSFEEILETIKNCSDNRELIPEMFWMVEYFYNLNRNFFGRKSSEINSLVNNIQVPFEFKSPEDFVYNLRIKTNSKDLSTFLVNWIDNIFGYYQNTLEVTRCNTFGKYSYEFNVNLSEKKQTYLNERKWNEEQVKLKIKGKIDRILMFGQCPLRWFEKQQKFEDLKIDKNEEGFLEWKRSLEYKVITDDEVLFISLIKNTDKLYFLFKDSNKDYSIAWYFMRDIKKIKQINIDKIKMFRKKNETTKTNSPSNSSTNIQCPYYFTLHPKFALIDWWEGDVFITARNYDNSLKMYKTTKEKEHPNYFYSIQTESFVSCIYKINESTFYTGHKNGEIIEWMFNKDIYSQHRKSKYEDFFQEKVPLVTIKRNVYAHYQSMITAITYFEKHELLITASMNGNMYIRKAYDFELLNIISLNKLSDNYYYMEITLSKSDWIYAMVNESSRNNKNFSWFAYTLNGLCFAKKKNFNWRNFYVTSKGKVIVGLDNGKIVLFDGANGFTTEEYSFYPEDAIKHIEKTKRSKDTNNEAALRKETISKMLNYFIFVEDDLYLFYCIYVDGTFIQLYNHCLERKLNLFDKVNEKE